MRTNNLLGLIALLGVSALISCNNPAAISTRPVVMGQLTFQKSDGPDCSKPDSLRNNCAEIDMSWPVVKEGSDALKKSVAAWSESYISGILAPPSDSATATTTTVEAAAAVFFKMHEEWTKEAPDSPLGYYVAETTDTVLLNDGKHLTLHISGYTFTGGAHGSPTAAVASFETQSGKLLGWTDLVTDTAALRVLAEKKFREERADVFKPEAEDGLGYEFDDIFNFTLPMNFGLTDKGIFFYYVPYEVTPYAFGSTAFVIPFEELGTLWKKE